MAESSPAGLAGHAEIVELEALGRRAWPALEVEEFAGWMVDREPRRL